mmetsp:Transcript_27623/g.72804  ORF Transcript_27623/g.72804 Transcript_27623/m.72804 type:complete len:213 (-) Transcript_27623:696-1334(-)
MLVWQRRVFPKLGRRTLPLGHRAWTATRSHAAALQHAGEVPPRCTAVVRSLLRIYSAHEGLQSICRGRARLGPERVPAAVTLSRHEMPMLAVRRRKEFVHSQVHGWSTAQLVKAHGEPSPTNLPLCNVQESRDTPEAEGIDLVHRDIALNVFHLLDKVTEAIRAPHTQALQVATKIWFLTRLGHDELIEGPEGHHEHGQLQLSLRFVRIISQ